jgi:hypothetical protein
MRSGLQFRRHLHDRCSALRPLVRINADDFQERARDFLFFSFSATTAGGDGGGFSSRQTRWKRDPGKV